MKTFISFFTVIVLIISSSISIVNSDINSLVPKPQQTINNNNNTKILPNRDLSFWIKRLLNSIVKSNSFLDGTSATNHGPLQAPLNSITPTSAEARHYMNFAGAAYCERTLKTWTCPWCLSDYTLETIIANDTFQTLAYFAINKEKKEIIVAFRGSKNVQNFIRDFDHVPVRFPGSSGIKLHRGCKQMVDSLYAQMLAKLKILTGKYPDFKIIFTGHSLGGVEASLSVFYLFYFKDIPTNTKKIELYSYGMLRIGNRAFADYMNQLRIKIGRIVAKADAFPRITAPAAVGYYHFQNEIWIYDTANNGTDKNCAKTVYEDPNCSASMGPLYTIMDHMIYYHVNLVQFILDDIPPALLGIIPIVPNGASGPVSELIGNLFVRPLG